MEPNTNVNLTVIEVVVEELESRIAPDQSMAALLD